MATVRNQEFCNALRKLPMNAIVGGKYFSTPSQVAKPILNSGPIRDSSGVEVTVPYEKLDIEKEFIKSGGIGGVDRNCIWMSEETGLGSVTVERLLIELEKLPEGIEIGIVERASPTVQLAIKNTTVTPMITLDPYPQTGGGQQAVIWYGVG